MKLPAFCAALMGFASFTPLLPVPEGINFIETRLCASGRIIRLELPGQPDPADEAPMPCHAVCSRDEESQMKKTAFKGQPKG